MKLIAIDMDGTLLNQDSVISRGNADAIRETQKAGNRVVIATGRSHTDSYRLLREADLACPIISSNGAQVRDKDNTLIYQVPLPERAAAVILEYAETLGLYTELFDRDLTHQSDGGADLLHQELAERLNQEPTPNLALSDELWELAERQLTQYNLKPTLSLRAKLDDPDVTPLKILTFSFLPLRQEALTAQLEEYGKQGGMEDIVITQANRFNLELTHREAQKGVALQRMAARYDIPMHQTVAIGDSPNDLSMFEVAGHSIAMGDAHASIRERCDSVTLGSHEDGVAYALKNLLER